jgi:D-inositol-3-phosphate glycosyltransferase
VLVPSRNPAAFADALRRLGGDRAAREALGLAGRARVDERFTLHRMIEEYAAVYREVGTA